MPQHLTAWLPPGWSYSPSPVRDHGWRALARCAEADVDPEIFHPPLRDEDGPDRTPEGVEVCRACPVREACLDYALTVGDDLGVLGGVPERERAALRKALGAGPAREKATHGTPWAYNRHRRRGEDACAACREAKRHYAARLRRAEQGDPRPSERAVERARSHLACGHLTVAHATGDAVEATCGAHTVGRDGGGWRCSCGHGPACAHVVAVQILRGEAVGC